MGGGAGPAVLSPQDSNPADEAQGPIDLVSDTSESTDSQSDSDFFATRASVDISCRRSQLPVKETKAG